MGFWEILSGGNFCQIVDGGRCVKNGDDNYGSHESCTFEALRVLQLTTLLYQVEIGHDYLTVDGVRYSSGQAPAQGLLVAQGAQIVWKSDFNVFYAGFKVCATGIGTTIDAYLTTQLPTTTATATTTVATSTKTTTAAGE